MFARSGVFDGDHVATAGGSPMVAGHGKMSAFAYQVVGFIIVWLLIVFSMVAAG